MIVTKAVAGLKRHVARLGAQGRRIAFVPTMGNLHVGHLRLMEEARRHGDVVVASIYVNPLQFGPDEDFAAYPRTEDEDVEKLDAAAVDLLFLPREQEIYPRGRAAQTLVEVPGLGDILCGAARPGHFRGVTTVVNRLLNLVAPQVAVFGKKDYQQLLLIRLMVEDLGMPVEIIGAETVRDPDGLALSSRNNYLSETQRAIAPRLYETLCAVRAQVLERGRADPELEEEGRGALESAGFSTDYISIRRQKDLQKPEGEDTALVVLAAARLGRARLIDNVELELSLSK